LLWPTFLSFQAVDKLGGAAAGCFPASSALDRAAKKWVSASRQALSGLVVSITFMLLDPMRFKNIVIQQANYKSCRLGQGLSPSPPGRSAIG
jgi:hypothetical protein